MREDEQLNNSVRAARVRLGMSQQQLADAAGVARQTVGGIEAGRYAASTTVALRLARALGRTVEELFWLEDERPTIQATPALASSTNAGESRVVVAHVGSRWVAHRLQGETAFRTEIVPADGTVVRADGQDSWTVRLLDEPDTLARTVIVAGCAPALALWARSAERWHPGVRVHWIHANSSEALEMLRRGEAHAAGLHVADAAESGNRDLVRSNLVGGASLVNLGIWQEGLLVAAGNPKGICGVADLAHGGARIVNREGGAGSRTLLERALAAAGVVAGDISGWNTTVRSHEAVARAVAHGEADAGMSTESMAALFGLGFVPVRAVRYDIAVRDEYLSEPHVREFFATLDHRWVRTQLRLLGGFDTTSTGETTPV